MSTHSLDLERSSSQYASIADASQTGLDLAADCSFEYWLKVEQLPSTAGGNFVLTSKWGAGNLRGYSLILLSTDKLRFSCSADGTADAGKFHTSDSDAAVITSADVGTWIHLAISYDDSADTAVFYKNGKSVALTKAVTKSTAGIYNTSGGFFLGSEFNGSEFYDGLIKDVRVFSDIRTQAEIVADAHTENVSDANLVGEWNFNNAYTDSSGNSNTLTATGSPVFSTDRPWEGATQVSGSTYLETNLVSYYTLDEASGNRADSTATANTLTDGNTVASGTGKISNGAVFTRADEDSLRSSTLWVNAYQSVAISCWAKTTNTATTEQTIWTNGNATSTGVGYCLMINGQSKTDGTISFLNHGVGWHHSSHVVSDTNFHHYAVSIDASGNVIIYMDGIASATLTGATTRLPTNGSGLSSENSASATRYLDGTIDETAIYSRALHYGDVLDLYNAGDGITYAAAAAGGGSARRLHLMSM